MSFASLGLSEPLLRAVAELGYVAPTPIQTLAIPAVLGGRDVWASAQTGSGKTAAFVLPILERLGASPSGRVRTRPVRALIVVPTRELAAQIADAVQRYGRYQTASLKVCVAVGGVSINPQMMALRGGADIVVATPGRLLDLVEQNAVGLSAVETLVLDEADRLLSLGFADELKKVLALVHRPQTLLLSATFPPAVRALAQAILHEPSRIDVREGASLEAAPDQIAQRAILVDVAKRTLLLLHLLKEHAWSRVLVFAASRYTTEHVADKLRRAGLAAAALHGDLAQATRTKVLADFKAERLQVLVATDLAARGIDIVQLPAVVNYDLPRSAVDYTHRIGRTGRAGEAGVAISFVGADTEAHFRLIEKKHRLRLEREVLPGFEITDVPKPTLDAHGGIKGRRKSKKDKLREAAALATSRGAPKSKD